jgi:squalene synthase HpnC
MAEVRRNDPSPAEAYAFCRRLAETHYENFPVASRWIPADLRGPVAAVYAFARTADDFADEPGPEAPERLARLADWRRRLERCAVDDEGHPVFVALADTVRRFDLPLDPFHRLITAFERDVTVHRHPTFDHLLDYCRHSADPVGELVLRLHRVWTPERGKWSDAICTALQLANFWQDVTVDARKDRIYAPLEDLAAAGVSEGEYLKGPATPALRGLMSRQVERTAGLFNQGRPLLSDVPAGLRKELRLVWLGGREILNKIQKRDYDVWSVRPALSKWDWLRLGGRWLMGAPA